MKTMKKILALVVAVFMMMAVSVTAFAAGTVNAAKDTFTYTGTGETTNGTITVDNAVVGEGYTLYKIFDATYQGDSVAYTIPAGALKTYLAANGTDYFTIGTVADANGNYSVTRKGSVVDGVFTPTKTDTELLAFIKTIPTSNFTLIGSIDSAGATTINFVNIPYGYYFMTSSLGSLVTIDSNKPVETINEKNSMPSDTKQVKDSNLGTYGTHDDAQVGDTVEFKITVTDGKGTNQIITVHDTMSAGLTLVPTSFVVTGPKDVENVKTDGQTLTAGVEYEVKTGNAVSEASAPKCTFEIVLKADYVTYLAENDVVTITYNAILNNTAVVGTPETNTSHITYSHQSTVDKTVNVDTYKVDILKFDGADNTKAPIAGAKFQLQDASGNPIWLTNGTAAAGFDVYEVLDTTGLTAVKDPTDNTKIIGWQDANGHDVTAFTDFTTTAGIKVRIDGLDNHKTYLLDEIEAPLGYNKLQTKTTVTATDPQNTETLTFADQEIANNKGAELPSTGGIGTTIFYVLGAILVIGAGVVLVTRRRVNDEH